MDDPLDATEIVSWKEKKNDGYKKMILRGLKSTIYFQESRNPSPLLKTNILLPVPKSVLSYAQ